MVMENKFKFKVLMHVHVRPLELISCCLEAHGLAANVRSKVTVKIYSFKFFTAHADRVDSHAEQGAIETSH